MRPPGMGAGECPGTAVLLARRVFENGHAPTRAGNIVAPRSEPRRGDGGLGRCFAVAPPGLAYTGDGLRRLAPPAIRFRPFRPARRRYNLRNDARVSLNPLFSGGTNCRTVSRERGHAARHLDDTSKSRPLYGGTLDMAGGLPVPGEAIPIGIVWDKTGIRSPSATGNIPNGIIRPFLGRIHAPGPAWIGDRPRPMDGAIPRPIRRIRTGPYTGQYSGVRPKRPKNSASGREYAGRGIFRGKGRL